MARAKHSVTDLFAFLLVPVTDAIHAETGHTLTRPQWSRIARTVAAKVLRTLAGWIEPQPEPTQPVASQEPVAVEPSAQMPKVEFAGENAVPAPAPVVPFGWDSVGVDCPNEPEPEPAPAPLFVSQYTPPTPEQWAEIVAEAEAVATTREQPAEVLVSVEPSAPVAPSKPKRAPRKPKTPTAKEPAATVDAPKVWTVSQVAKVHGIPAKTLRTQCQNGKVPATQVDGSWVIADADVRALVQARKGAGKASKGK